MNSSVPREYVELTRCVSFPVQGLTFLSIRLRFAQIAGFEKTFTIAATGISRPKIVTCVGSRGTRCVQLVKGHDEIRQDAVMEQVFGYVNELLRRRRGRSDRSSISGNRDLRVVTYNIVPLSPAAGVSMGEPGAGP